MSKVTPRPWAIFEGCIVSANADFSIPLNSKWVTSIDSLEVSSREANAAHIVKCVNMHEQLVEENEKLKVKVLGFRQSMSAAGQRSIERIRALEEEIEELKAKLEAANYDFAMHSEEWGMDDD